MAFDIVGNIAIIPKNKATKKLAKELIKRKNIEAVYAREEIKTKHRVPKLRHLAGKKETKTIHKESSCMFKLDVKKCYFTPRLSNDRLEIARKIKKGEKVLVMFSGIAPYPIIIAKYSKAKVIYAIEINREAVKYAEENLRLNKVSNIKLFLGDVKEVVPKIARKIKFDRIVMPRPQVKESFLKEAFLASKKGTIIHFYDFVIAKELDKVKEKIEKEAKKAKKKVKILSLKKVREIAPYKYHIRVDFKIL